MNEDKGYLIHCSRCGAEMNSNSRYCMKCGNLNYDHEANQNMKQYIKSGAVETYQVGSGQFVVNSTNNKDEVVTSIGSNTGNKTICFLLNFVLYIVTLGILFYILFKDTPLSIDLIMNSYFPYISTGVTLLFLYLYSIELVFMKCNKKWWYSLIPIYSNMIMGEIVFNSKLMGLLTIIPIVGPIISIVMLYKLGKQFNYNGVLVVLFFPIFLILLGFGSHLYENHAFIEGSSNESVERAYKYKKIFLMVSMPILIIGFVLVFRLNLDFIKKGGSEINKYYFVLASKKTVNKTKNIVKNRLITCPDSDYKKDSGVYYLYFADIGKFVFLPFYYQREAISGYVKIDNTSGESKYYISISDGNLGFGETLIDDVNTSSVVSYGDISPSDISMYNVCTREKSEYAR